MKKTKFIITICCAALLASCASVRLSDNNVNSITIMHPHLDDGPGKQVSMPQIKSRIAQIHPGMTDAQVRGILNPMSVLEASDGSGAKTYRFNNVNQDLVSVNGQSLENYGVRSTVIETTVPYANGKTSVEGSTLSVRVSMIPSAGGQVETYDTPVF